MPIIVEYISVLYADGSIAPVITSVQASRLLRAGEAKAVGKGKHLRCIQLSFSPGDPTRLPAGTQFSHDYETKDNPPRVWKHKYRTKTLGMSTLAVMQSVSRYGSRRPQAA